MDYVSSSDPSDRKLTKVSYLMFYKLYLSDPYSRTCDVRWWPFLLSTTGVCIAIFSKASYILDPSNTWKIDKMYFTLQYSKTKF